MNTIAGKEITVGGYIDTVLMRHFEENKDEIKRPVPPQQGQPDLKKTLYHIKK